MRFQITDPNLANNLSTFQQNSRTMHIRAIFMAFAN